MGHLQRSRSRKEHRLCLNNPGLRIKPRGRQGSRLGAPHVPGISQSQHRHVRPRFRHLSIFAIDSFASLTIDSYWQYTISSTTMRTCEILVVAFHPDQLTTVTPRIDNVYKSADFFYSLHFISPALPIEKLLHFIFWVSSEHCDFMDSKLIFMHTIPYAELNFVCL